MNVASIIMSIHKEMLASSQELSKEQLSPEPIFDPISHRPPTHLPKEHRPHLRPDPVRPVPVDIFSLPEIRDYPPPNPEPILIEPFTGPFAELDKDIEEEIQSFRAEADKANEQALKKQIEALKNIISDQKNREW